jgi:uncharacterized membrane protein YkvA (DUF1232 family)
VERTDHLASALVYQKIATGAIRPCPGGQAWLAGGILAPMGSRLSRTGAFVALWRQLRASRHGGPSMGARLRALPRMIAASLRPRQRYDGLWRLVLMAVALLYVVWPLDLVPELLLGPLALIDDAVLVTWLAGAVLSETGRFLEWEQRTRGTLPAVER